MIKGASGRKHVTENTRHVFPEAPFLFYKTVDELKLEKCVQAGKAVHSSSALVKFKDTAVVAHVGVNLCKHKTLVLDDTDLRRLQSEHQA